MTHHAPPKLATALLKHLGPHNPALLGDLSETYQARPSRWWYWRQVLGVVWTHTWTAVGSSATWSMAGITIAVLVLEIPFLLHAPLYAPVRLTPERWLLLAMYLVPSAATIAVPIGFMTWFVGGRSQFSRPNPTLALMAAAVGCMATFTVMGWLVPLSNQAFRVTLVDRYVMKGAGELSFLQLRSVVGVGESARFALASIDRWETAARYHAVFAVSVTPIAFAIVGLWAAAWRPVARRLVAVAVASVYLAYFLIGPEWARSLPPILAAWLPTIAIGAVALLLRWSSPGRTASA
jgi:hypothetical protein